MKEVKNVRPGILIVADAGLRLGPGRVLEVGKLTRHMERPISVGLLAKSVCGSVSIAISLEGIETMRNRISRDKVTIRGLIDAVFYAAVTERLAHQQPRH